MRREMTWITALLVACGSAVPEAEEPERFEAQTPPLPWERAVAEDVAVESPPVAIVGGTVMTAAGRTIEDGVVVMEDGRIRAVGTRDEVEIPDGAEVVDASGRWVTPGLIDTHSHMGVYAQPHVNATSDGNEATAPVTAELWAGDSFWPQDPALPRAIAGGVTTIQVLPGSTNLIGGRGVILKLHLGRSVQEMRFPGAPDTLKMACGENPKRVYGNRNSAPSTRMGNVAGYRAAFQQAIEYGRSWRDWQHNHRIWQGKRAEYEAYREELAEWERERDAAPPGEAPEAPEEVDDPGPEPAPPARNFQLESLLGAIEGRVLVQMHCYRADEMARMLQLGEEMGFRIRSFHHAVEAYKIRDLLARYEVGVSTWTDWWGFKLEAFDSIPENLALLSESGVHAALHSDSASLVQRLNQEAGKAMAAGRRAGIGVSEETALRWVTAEPAWVLGIAEQTGTLEVGKMADVVVWSGHPFSVYTRADRVYIDGLLAFDRARQVRAGTTDFELGHGVGEAEGLTR